MEQEEQVRELTRMIRVQIDEDVYENVARACIEPGYWTTVFAAYKDKPVWTHTQALGSEYVVDFNVYTPRMGHTDDEPMCCWCEAVIFKRDADDPTMLHEENCIMGDDDPFTTPWSFDLGGYLYQVNFV